MDNKAQAVEATLQQKRSDEEDEARMRERKKRMEREGLES